ncbi:hypothetical protein LCGC14_2762740 [marine sediment metagenome]|uniref:Uncharacterized protein n=1 Tax=marine sediment metagenome TaxID=412755 RepID=A0A0F8ZKE0_9ZZZZ|nr:hypothetical protein [bacterium]
MGNEEETYWHYKILKGVWRFNSGLWNAILKYRDNRIIFQRLDSSSMETSKDNLIIFTPEKIKDLYHWLEARGAFDG